jgi:transposase InsO family protein
MKYLFVTQHKKTWPIDLMCRVLGVSRQGYYHYRRNTEAKLSDPEHQEMLDWMTDIAIASKYTYGRRRMKRAMNALGFPISRTQTVNLMKEADVQVRHKKKFKVTTNSNHKLPLFENLLERQFDVEQPNQVFASDITYVWTQEGWLYLAVVIDLYSRKVVGWSMSSRMTAQLVCDALTMAIWLRRPKAGLIHHSDRGSQYASKAFRRLLKAHGIKGSMSRKGDCWDNAVVEAFFASLKKELIFDADFLTSRQAVREI